MSFSDHKIAAFAHRIADLPDQPNLPADELKARFDSSPEELRQSLNSICDDADALTIRVDQHGTQLNQIAMNKFPDDTIKESNLHPDLAAKLNGMATQTALAAETSARQALITRVATAESKLNTHTTQIAQKCEAYIGTYTGDGADTRTISLGFKPKAVFAVCIGYYFRHEQASAALAVDGSPVMVENDDHTATKTALAVASNGFTVGQGDNRHLNCQNILYHYIAFR